MKKRISVKSIIVVSAAIIALWLVLWELFYVALRDGQRHSEEFFLRRISQSLLVDSGRLRYLDGARGCNPHVFFELTGSIPAAADVRVLEGDVKEYFVKRFNELATRYHLPCAAGNDDELLNYNGQFFDLYLTKTKGGYFILYL